MSVQLDLSLVTGQHLCLIIVLIIVEAINVILYFLTFI